MSERVSPMNPPPSAPADARLSPDTGIITRQQWKWSALAGMASYLDAGSIVALGAGLALFQTYLGLTDRAIGFLGAIGPNALGCAIGAIFGGWLGDKLGRKFIYQYDLMVYAAGILCIALAINWPMLLVGTFVVGLAVGIDVPTSLALVGELAPANARGKLLGFTQVAWSLGPVIVLVLAWLLTPFNEGEVLGFKIIGARIVFLHLFVAAVVTWALRRGLAESVRWKNAARSTTKAQRQIRNLFRGANLRALVWTGAIYLFWNLAAGTAGQFNPYIISTLNAGSQGASVLVSSANFIMAMIITITVFMRFSDRGFKTRKTLWAIGAVTQVISYGLFLVFPLTMTTALLNIALFGGGCALAGEAFYKVFSQELFPTILRGTAQGFTFGTARTLLAIWSFFVPMLAHTDLRLIAGLLTLFLLISGAVGFFFMPDTSGKSLEQIEAERA